MITHGICRDIKGRMYLKMISGKSSVSPDFTEAEGLARSSWTWSCSWRTVWQQMQRFSMVRRKPIYDGKWSHLQDPDSPVCLMEGASASMDGIVTNRFAMSQSSELKWNMSYWSRCRNGYICGYITPGTDGTGINELSCRGCRLWSFYHIPNWRGAWYQISVD